MPQFYLPWAVRQSFMSDPIFLRPLALSLLQTVLILALCLKYFHVDLMKPFIS